MKKMKVTTQWVLSYLLILILPVLSGAGIYQLSFQTLQRQAKEIQDNSIRQAASIWDNLYENLQNVSMTFVTDESVQTLSYTGQWNGRSFELVPKLQNLIEKTQSVNREYDNILLYFPMSGYTMGSSSLIPAGSESVSYEVRLGIGWEEYESLLQKGNGFFILENGQIIYLFSRGTQEDYQNRQIILGVVLDHMVLQQIFSTEQDSLEQRSFYLSNAEGEYYSLSAKDGGLTDTEREELEWYEEQVPAGTGQWHGSDYWCSQSVPGTNLMLYGVIRSGTVFRQMQQARMLLIVYIVVCLGAGMVLSVWLAKRNYQPVERLLELMKKGASRYIRENGGGNNELEQLQNSLATLLEEYEAKRKIARSYEETKANIEFQNLLRPAERYEQYGKESYERLTAALPGNTYVLLEFDVQDAGEETRNFTEISVEEKSMLLFVVKNVAGELLEKEFSFLGGEIDGFYCFLIAVEEAGATERLKSLREFAKKATDFLYQYYQLRIWVNVSDVHEDYPGIQTCYQEIQELNIFRDYVGSQETILFFRQLQEKEEVSEYLRQLRLEREIGEQLKRHQLQAIQKLLSEFTGQEKKEKEREKERETGTISARTEYDELMEKICRYIQEHYQEPQLTVNALADQYHFSPSALSKLFYRKQGVRMLEYISDIRMTRAKELLAGGMSVKDTAEAVGYYNIRPLVRLFKASEGMTPAEYQKSLEQQ